MKTLMDIYFSSTEKAYSPRDETFNGEEYLVVPVVMMLEGVHSGSHGAILHTAEELGRFPESWNGIPLTNGHPSINGNYVSANSPSVLAEWSFGTVFNAHMDGEKLRAEAWINKEDISSINPTLLERINQGEPIEVSVGVFSDEEVVAGVFNNERYTAIAHNHRPDHLALLPDEVGACSLADGCGIRVNKRGVEQMFQINKDNKNDVLKALSISGIMANETGFMELRNKIQASLDKKDGNGKYHYIDEVFADSVVYVESDYENGTRRYYKQSYQENAAGEAELTGEAVRVKKVIDYPAVIEANSTQRVRTKFNNNKGGEKMNAKDCNTCKEKVNALIANTKTPYTEDDRPWMEELELNALNKLEPTVVETPATVTNEQIISAFRESVKTPEDFLNFVPVGMREQFQSGLEMQNNAKATMVQGIMDNTEDGVWEKEELEAMPTKALTKIYKSVVAEEEKKDVLYLGGGNSLNANSENEGVEVMAPIGVEFKTN